MKIITTKPAENIYFHETEVEMDNMDPRTEWAVVNIFDEFKYQQVLGFGGAFTEAAAYNYALMSEKEKEKVLKAYFDEKEGIGYNFGRTHINSCDFSLDIYTYVQEGDKTLDTFDISRDKKYIIPFIKDAMKYCNDELVLFASPWSPPAYMKDNGSMIKGGKLLEEYKELWALYYAKYIKAYRQEGIKITAISVQNEPLACQTWESCQYDAEDEGTFIAEYLVPVLEREGLSDIKIIIWDHNKERVYDRAKKTFENPVALEKTWGVGHHWYSGDHFDGMRLVHEKFNKVLISSENCGQFTDTQNTGLAERYAREIAENFNNFDNAFCDWNLILDMTGGPFHNRTQEREGEAGAVIDMTKDGCYAPILFDEKKGEAILTDVYYYIGHFSKYVKRGATRIAYTKHTDGLTVCPFENPNGEKVVVIMNTTDGVISANIRYEGGCTRVSTDPHSIQTLIF